MKKVTPQNHATTANINKRIKFLTSQKMTMKFILSRTYKELQRQKIYRKKDYSEVCFDTPVTTHFILQQFF